MDGEKPTLVQESVGDLAGRTRQLVAHHKEHIEGDMLHECWEVIPPDLAATAAPLSRTEA